MEASKRLICINQTMFSPDLISAAMALTAHGSLCTPNPNATPAANSEGANGKAKKQQKDRDEKERELKELKMELSREFRCTHFPLVHALLQNPLRELISNVPPTSILSEVKDEKNNFTLIGAPRNLSETGGLLFLYDGSLPNYAEDDIEWQTAKMSVKLIVCNPNTGTYKLKNNRNDEGTVVMRRQTWQGKKTLAVLPSEDGKEGGKTIRTWRKHEYKLVQREKFYKPSPDGGLVVDQLQRILEFPVLVHYFVKTVDANRANRKRKAQETEGEKDDVYEPPAKIPNLTRAPPSSAPSQLPTTGSLIPSLSSHAGLASLLPSEGTSYQQFSPSLLPPSSYSGLTDSFSNLLDTSFDNLPEVELRLCHYPSLQIPLAPPLRDEVKAKIKTYAPDGGAWEDITKVILIVEGFPKPAPGERPNVYSIRFADIEVPAHEAGPGVLEFSAPPHHSPGVVYFWAVCRQPSSSVVYSNPVPFFYYPSDEQGHLRLDFRGLNAISGTNENGVDENGDDSEPAIARRRAIVNRFKYYVRELDVSNNGLTELAFCSDLSKLHTLIADNNRLSANSPLPYLPSLKTLSINFNCITSLESFLDNVENSFPNLTYLSLINNEACPYFSKLSHHYYNYRIYVISRLPNLQYLDSSQVTSEEHRHASCIASSDPSSPLRDHSTTTSSTSSSSSKNAGTTAHRS